MINLQEATTTLLITIQFQGPVQGHYNMRFGWKQFMKLHIGFNTIYLMSFMIKNTVFEAVKLTNEFYKILVFDYFIEQKIILKNYVPEIALKNL